MVSSQFLEFWGTLLLNAAKGQKQLQQMSESLQKGFSGADDMAALFRKTYGLEAAPDTSSAGGEAFQRARKNFEQAFKEYAAQWGWVPRSAYAELQRKCEELEKTIQSQTHTIDQLHQLLEIKNLGSVDLMERFQSIVKDQSEEFLTLMGKLGQAMTKDPQGGR